MKVQFNPVPENAAPAQKQSLAELKKLSREFESLFLKEVITAMRKSVPEDGIMSGGKPEKIYRSMQDDQLAREMAAVGTSGIAQTLYNSLSQAYLNSGPASERSD